MKISGQLHAPAALTLGKDTPVPLEWEAGWDPELVWILARRDKYLASTRNRNHDSSGIQCVA
jgi:hypothetical protein